jgi:hypothetical protein
MSSKRYEPCWTRSHGGKTWTTCLGAQQKRKGEALRRGKQSWWTHPRRPVSRAEFEGALSLMKFGHQQDIERRFQKELGDLLGEDPITPEQELQEEIDKADVLLQVLKGQETSPAEGQSLSLEGTEFSDEYYTHISHRRRKRPQPPPPRNRTDKQEFMNVMGVIGKRHRQKVAEWEEWAEGRE